MPSDLGLQVKQQRKALNAQESRQLSTCLSHPNTYFCPPPFAPDSGASCFKPQVFISAFLQLGCSQKSVAGELRGLVPPARAPEVWGARGAHEAGQGPPTAAGVGSAWGSELATPEVIIDLRRSRSLTSAPGSSLRQREAVRGRSLRPPPGHHPLRRAAGEDRARPPARPQHPGDGSQGSGQLLPVWQRADAGPSVAMATLPALG